MEKTMIKINSHTDFSVLYSHEPYTQLKLLISILREKSEKLEHLELVYKVACSLTKWMSFFMTEN